MKTIFITGASSGIGKETAKYFSRQGWRVIATMRNLKKGEDLQDLPNMVILPLDVSAHSKLKKPAKRH
ncbi:MAG: SDR family NAD(P)-dependent oxidoreductase [Megasphaera massiliensis]|nr:SDR family NAD(P)-dependent oxidoreductase [Megasphaera massiliensis]MDY2966159.1 SDR family NAD(P)-dependent oxidoreductase [Megasphaera massiliensis]